ncbi:TonB dependent receptor [compost metagenome]
MSFLKSRLGLTVDVYKRVTTDLLLNAELPYSHGIQSSTGFKNIGRLENRGVEITLNSTNVKTKNFNWTSNFNISFNKNKILDLNEGQNSLIRGSGTFFNTTYTSLSPYISVKGRSVGEMYGLIFDGVYQYSDFDKMPNGSFLLKNDITTNGATRASIQPGDIKYKDLNGDLVVNNNDYTIIGRGLPIHTGGFSNNFSYKAWDLGVFLQWSYGNNIINANRYVFEGGIVTNPNLNQFASFENRWTPTNQTNDLFRAGGMTAANYSSRVVEDGSYLRLKTVQLGYNFVGKLLKSTGMSKLRLNVSAQNLLTFTGYSGLDPEASSRPGNLTPGFDYGTYPQSFTVTFGLNAAF